MMLGLSARYNDVDGDSSDSSMLSRCASPQVDFFHSLDSSLESCSTSQPVPRDEILSDNAEQDGEVTVWLSHSPSSDVFTSVSPPVNDRSRKHRRILQTAFARTTARERFQSHKLWQSVDEHVTCSTPDLRSSSRSLSETSDRESMRAGEDEIPDRLVTDAERRRTGLRGSLAVVSQVRNSFQQHFIADGKRRRRRHVAKHIFTADSTEPQLVSLRRFCDDYRTSCLQQNLTARRCSLDRMLSAEAHASDNQTTIHRLSNVAEESAASSAGVSNVSIELSCTPLDLRGEVDADNVGQSHENDNDTVMSTPTDDRTAECDGNSSEQMSDFLGDSVGSCMTATSVISDSESSAQNDTQCVAVDSVIEDTAESYFTVANTAVADEEHSRALSEVDDVGAVEQQIDHVTTTSAAASDLLLSSDDHTSQEMTCTHVNIATDDLLLPVHTSGEVCVDWLCTVDNAVISRPTSTDDLINFSQTSDELTSSLSENCFGDSLIADVASACETSCQLNAQISTRPGWCASETLYKEEDDNSTAVSANSGPVLVTDEYEETWL